MAFWRHASLKAKIIFSTALMVAVSAGAIAITLIILARPAAENLAIQRVQEIAQGQESRIQEEIGSALRDGQAIARTVQTELSFAAPRRAPVNR